MFWNVLSLLDSDIPKAKGKILKNTNMNHPDDNISWLNTKSKNNIN